MRQLYRCSVLFLIMGSSYYFIEILYDGSSHWSMFLVGGICGVFGDLLDEYRPGMKILHQCLLITMVILALEYLAGYYVNIHQQLNIWDYSKLPLNLNGQICLVFGLIWFLIFSPLIIWLGDGLRFIIWKEDKPVFFFAIYSQLLLDIWKAIKAPIYHKEAVRMKV